jgi:hypothetical protein
VSRSVAKRATLCLAAMVLLACLASPSPALELAPDVDARGRKILWLRDCDSRKRTCQEHEESFFLGRDRSGRFLATDDAVRLRAELKRSRYSEVWLSSGGGNLISGIRVGQVLREERQFVRVPRGSSCISACTVAFLGGVLRAVDHPGASYEVHASSGALFWEQVSAKARSALQAEPEAALAAFASAHAESARLWAAALLSYFQTMINGQPSHAHIMRALAIRCERPLSEGVVWRVVVDCDASEPSGAATSLPYLTDGRLKRDAERIRIEGTPAMQEIVMALERESMALAIARLRTDVDSCGPRAAHALKMLEIMFSSRILGTASLSQETLREMGYVNVRSE